jgi:hypothetical protein
LGVLNEGKLSMVDLDEPVPADEYEMIDQHEHEEISAHAVDYVETFQSKFTLAACQFWDSPAAAGSGSNHKLLQIANTKRHVWLPSVTRGRGRISSQFVSQRYISCYVF